MRRLHYFGWRQRKGIALLLVMFIAFASLVLLTTLYSSLAPRSISVRGQAQSDRALALADGTIDRLLDQINSTGLTYSVAAQSSVNAVTNALVIDLLLNINGGLADTVLTNVRHYFYDITTDTYYVLKNDADPVATGILTNLSTGTDVAGGLMFIDNKYASDNRWFELDANAKYWYNPDTPTVVNPDTWEIGATAFNLSNPDIKRTVRAEAQRGNIIPSTVANGNWYFASMGTPYFSDYTGLYHSRVNFGRFEVITGYVRSDSDLYMGGWAKDKVYAVGSVSDEAIDDYHNNHDGRFGIDTVGLSTAKSQGLATDHVATASWPNGSAALTTLSNNAASGYKVSGNATIVFSVVGGVGKVTINGTLRGMPANGAIYVGGDATVSGTLRGKVTIGANDDIFIGGNITYTNPPRTDKNAPPVDASLQDKLGLIARDDIIIPDSTYDDNKTLRIDAAMLAVNGYFGLDVNANYSSHSITSSPHWVGIWNGSQSVFSGDSAPAISNGSSVTGYEQQHTNYDYNLANGARPPFFPATLAPDGTTATLEYVVYTGTDLATLQTRTQGQLTPVTSGPPYADGMRYSYYLSGTTYYCSNATSWSYGGIYGASANSLYRVSWKEEIAKPVGSP